MAQKPSEVLRKRKSAVSTKYSTDKEGGDNHDNAVKAKRNALTDFIAKHKKTA